MGKHRGRRPGAYGGDLYKTTSKLDNLHRQVVDTSKMDVSDIPSRCPACAFYLGNALRAARKQPTQHTKGCAGCNGGSCRRTGKAHLVGCPNKDNNKVTGLARTWAKNKAEAVVAADKAAATAAAAAAESTAASSAASSSSSAAAAASSSSSSTAAVAPTEKRKRPRTQSAMQVVPAVVPASDNGVLMLDTPLNANDLKFLTSKRRKFKTLRSIMEPLLRSRLRLGQRGGAVPAVEQPWPFMRGTFPLLCDSLTPSSLTSVSEAEWALLGADVYWLDLLRSHPFLQGVLRCVAIQREGRSRGTECNNKNFVRTGFDFDSANKLGLAFVKEIEGHAFVADMSMQCRKCGEKYTCFDRRILLQLPRCVQVSLPINIMEAEVGKRTKSVLVGKGLERLTAACVTRWQGFETVSSLFAEVDGLHMLDREKVHVSLLPDAAPPAAAAAAATLSAAAASSSSASSSTPAASSSSSASSAAAASQALYMPSSTYAAAAGPETRYL